MGIQKQEKYTCDLCGLSKIAGKETKDWIIIEIEDSFQDRMWHKKVVCKYCLNKIRNTEECRKNKVQ